MRVVVRWLEPALLWGFLLGLGVSISLAQLALGALAVSWLVRLGEPGRRDRLPFPLLAPMGAFAAATVLAALASARPVASLAGSKDLLLLATVYLILHTLPGPEAAARLLSRLLLILAVVSVMAIVQVMACPSDPGWIPLAARFFKRCDRAHAFYSIYVTLAGVLSVGLLAVLPRLLPGGADRRWWMAPAWAAGLVALALTYVRGAWIGLGAGLVVLGGLARRGRWWLLAGLLAAVTTLVAGPPGLRQRALSIADPADLTARERVFMLRAGLAIARDHPLTGVGPGQVKEVYPRYVLPGALRSQRSHVHNTPLRTLMERGPLGLLAWGWLWVAFFAETGRALQRLAPGQARERTLIAGSIAAVAGFLVAGLFEFNFGDSEVAMVAYAVMALALAATRLEEAARRDYTGV
ncbi:MAG: O-antigen ligase family protein [Candidatus Rokubacteria bacterium]|nr:O-antigen ligase family protein [Candidatus Rokubacteria bacterium]